jgi:hypothetical protein
MTAELHEVNAREIAAMDTPHSGKIVGDCRDHDTHNEAAQRPEN